MSGVQVGLRDLHYAILNQDDANGVSYDTPVKISGFINAKITPTTNSETLYADDGPAEVATSLGEITVELQVKDLPLDVQAALLGHTVSDGMLIKNADDQAPYVAIGFRSLKSNGKYRYVWLYKGKFTTPEAEFQTKEDKPTFQTPTISGSFLKREYDGAWQVVGDEDMPGFNKADTWFDSVVNASSDTNAPTVMVTPADGATGVAVTSNIVWTFDEPIQESTVTPANFFVVDSTGAEVAGTLSLSADKTTVTFDPTSDLTSATSYTAIATKNVKDLAGNSLAQNSVTNFTTA
ncbi:major tail protein [Thermoactinomyces sp. CICC 10521]|uniref:major tail protein n=1 Tax=Thermoactinomyces sp. CICC 10521 TaxID=2767426 RepID=UPI0018DEA2E2|nr:major tail protein [Thermoactinomyces sp. CICC 10521]MBH8605989.1 Ig-like domain-containing protein [Thermoactinomyces sp. CICC 10521]